MVELTNEVMNLSNSEKLLRLIKIISLIDRKNGATLNNLLDECDVCERTIYRDLDAITQSGLPIYFDSKSKRYRFTEKVFLRPLTFSVEEARSILACLHDFSTYNSPLGQSVRMARDKILASLPQDRQTQLDKACQAVDIRVASRQVEVCREIFSCVERAIQNQQQLKMCYYTKTRESAVIRR